MNVIENHQKVSLYLQKIEAHIKQNHSLQWQKYVQLGSKIVKLVCYSKEFIPHIEKQLSYTLRDNAHSYDATIIMWNEKEIKSLVSGFLDNHVKARMRVEQLVFKTKDVNFTITDNINSRNKISATDGIINAYDQENNVYYYGVRDLDPEEFIKQGHIFVQIFNKIIKSANANLVHAAVVGIDNHGILFCARGQRGKSTLAVLSMMEGFEYVSDDYLILEKEGDKLYSYPIYSIITLSPKMYNKLYDDLKGKFISNNARKDKYVIDIKAYHESFRDKYPIKVCMFPQIVADKKPSIIPCKKGRAIAQLVHSTIIQLEDKHDIATIRKLISFIKDFDFYQINLCSDIKANVECLRKFYSKIN